MVYHYCPASYLSVILADGLLLPSAEGAGGSEQRALWFTSRPSYEPTAVKLIAQGGLVRRLTLAEQAHRFGLARFSVPDELAPLTWLEWIRRAGVRPAEAKRMARYARRIGSDVSLYRATFDAVPVAACLTVETSTEGRHWSAPEPITPIL